MRVKIKFSKNTESVVNNLRHFNSYIHQCFGKDNEFHDKPSDYSCTGMLGGVITNGGRNKDFKDGGYIIFSSMDLGILDKFVLGVTKHPIYGFGMAFCGIEYIEDTFYTGDNLVILLGQGLLLKRFVEKGKYEYITADHKDFVDILTKQMKNKLSKINPSLDLRGLTIHCGKSKSVVVSYMKNVRNVSSKLILKINTNKKVMEHIYNYGIGQSTGSGFGNITYYDRFKQD